MVSPSRLLSRVYKLAQGFSLIGSLSGDDKVSLQIPVRCRESSGRSWDEVGGETHAASGAPSGGDDPRSLPERIIQYEKVTEVSVDYYPKGWNDMKFAMVRVK